MGALDARILAQSVRDARWMDSYGVRLAYLGRLKSVMIPPPFADEGDALLGRDGRPVLFGACGHSEDARVRRGIRR